MSASDSKMCCCSAFAGAGINAGLQLLCSVIGLSNASLVLSRDQLWKFLNAVFEPTTTTRPLITAAPRGPGIPLVEILTDEYKEESSSDISDSPKWINTWIEISMTWYMAFAAVWIFTILGLCLSFRFYRPVLVIPNIVTLFIGIFFNGSAFGSIFAWLMTNSKEVHERNSEGLILIYVMISFLVIFVLNIIFISISLQYHSFLHQRFTISPQKVFTTREPRPNADNDNEKY